MMHYISTRDVLGGAPQSFKPQSFEQVLLGGLAPDGGLYLPAVWPRLDLSSLKGKSYVETAIDVMYPFVEGSIPLDAFTRIVQETYSPDIFRDPDVVPLRQLAGLDNGNIHIMEQFYGPTIAFKDVALQLLGRLFDYVLQKNKQRVTIVGATSGDTGSAAIEGCKSCANIDIFILYPHGRVSDVQRRQMTTVSAPNVHNIALDGTFDDCQNMVKAMFNDVEFRNGVNLSAVNSINWARIMAQIVYYVFTAIRLGAADGKDVSFVVPTGNFGNVFAAYCARKMGLPIKTLMVSSNRNDILTRFFESGEMRMDGAFATLSPSMDIQISSNFERYLFDLVDGQAKALALLMADFKNSGAFHVTPVQFSKAKAEFCASRAGDDETLAQIKDCYEKTAYILDPHTAVGMQGARQLAQRENNPVVLLATAHPAKFPDAVKRAIGVHPALPAHLADLFTREEHFTRQPNDLKTVQGFVLERSKAIP